MALFSAASKARLVVSYVLDCIVIVVFAGIAGGLNFVKPTTRLISITDPDISYPNLPDTVSIATAFLAAVVAPAAVICMTGLFTVIALGATPRVWRRKLWDMFAALLGLALAVVLAFFVVQASKNLFGRPRPDFLGRCNPNLTNLAQFTDGGYTSESLEGTSVHVRYEVCQTFYGTAAEKATLDDGFRSFPSGHCTVSFAGLVYLSLFLAANLAAAIPRSPPTNDLSFNPKVALYERAAAPPLYQLVLALIPTGGAIYIAATRFSDYKHHGFDVLFSSFLGGALAWLSFRWYHVPINAGRGWTWGPRSRDHAFGLGVLSVHENGAREDETSSGRASDSASRRVGVSCDDVELGAYPTRTGTVHSDSSRAPIVQA